MTDHLKQEQEPMPVEADELPQTPLRKSNASIVWHAIVELSNSNRLISRHVLREITGLKTSIIDDHLERLDAKGRIRKVGGGLLEIIEEFEEPRSCSVTEIPSGWVKLEIGDECMLLQPVEARKLARGMAGYLGQMDEIERSSKALLRTVDLAIQVRELRAEVAAVKRAAGMDHSPRQLDLLE